jgi:hypothetical protein
MQSYLREVVKRRSLAPDLLRSMIVYMMARNFRRHYHSEKTDEAVV